MSIDGLVVISDMMLLVSEKNRLGVGCLDLCGWFMVVVSSVAVQMVAEQVERSERSFIFPATGD